MGHRCSADHVLDMAIVLFESAIAICKSISTLRRLCLELRDLGVPELLELQMNVAERKLFAAIKLYCEIVQIFRVVTDDIVRVRRHPQLGSEIVQLVLLSMDLINESILLRDQAQELLNFVLDIMIHLRYI